MHHLKIHLFLFFLASTCFGSHFIEVQGHRGCRGYVPENTIQGFNAAICAGVDSIEMDLLMTKDDEIIIYHDYFLNGDLCTCLDGTPIVDKVLICNLTLSQIKNIDCGCKRNPLFPCQKLLPHTQIPTLQEVFDVFKRKNVKLILEIKRDANNPGYTPSPEWLAKKVVELVKANHCEAQVYYSSFEVQTLKSVRELDPTANIEFISANGVNLIEIATSLDAKIISPHHRLLHTKEDVKALQKAGFRVVPWTVNDQKRWLELIKMGVDGIVTDYPQDLIWFLKQLCFLMFTQATLVWKDKLQRQCEDQIGFYQQQ